jgi:NADH dehydrogenase (ubiquinone) 1 alpha subcomplex subunit 10
MALNVGRSGLGLLRRLPGIVDGQPVLLVAGGAVRLPVATLRATYGEKYPYSEPFPYERKQFKFRHTFVDNTTSRFNENTKMIVVEGNIGVGKTEFAQRLAKEFDMKFFPSTSERQCFLYPEYNYDIRGLDSVMPETAKSYDLKRFYTDPHPEKGRVGSLQLLWYEQKFYNYIAALKHLVNTGQGVVMTTSVYSDSVFVEALRNMGWVTPNFVRHYNMIRDNSICELYRPHLTIYLDAPVSVVRERINKAEPEASKYRNLSDEYLTTIEKVYKQRFLPKMRRSGEVVEIDWTEVATKIDMDAIAEELQLLKLEGEDNDDVKFADWSRQSEDDWHIFRLFCESKADQQALFIRPIPWDCPEVLVSQDDRTFVNRLMFMHPMLKYGPGWAPEFGHKTAFKL